MTSASLAASKPATSQLSSWRSRVHGTGLVVDRFGEKAERLVKDATESCRMLTGAALDELPSGIDQTEALRQRSAASAKLLASLKEQLRKLHEEQVGIVAESATQKFKKDLLAEYRLDRTTAVQLEDSISRKALHKQAMADFNARTEPLGASTLGLSNAKAAQKLDAELTEIIDKFDESPAAKIKALKAVKKSAAKPKPPNERGIIPSLHMVAMLRPDGFGNLSGFGSYAFKAGHSLTVGLCNDADSPEVLNQFGGLRPPLIRIQPKLQLDVDL
jgi:hypothetical protein